LEMIVCVFVISFGHCIYNHLWIQCLSPLKLWVQIPLKAMCIRYNIMW